MTLTQLEWNSFQEFVDDRMNGDENLTLEDCVREWRVYQERVETIAAVRRGEADMAAGRYRTLQEMDTDFRNEFGLPPRTT